MELSPIGAPRRRPGGGGYPRGDDTRARIITAALRVFGEDGYARASTRHIADVAGVNPPALQYYFNGKEGLHRACAEFILERIQPIMAPAWAISEAALASGDPARMLEAVCDILDILVDFTLTSEEAEGWKRFMGRGQADDAGPAFTVLREGLTFPLHDSLAALIGPLIGHAADDEGTRLRTIAVLSPLSAFHVNRANALALLGWPDYAEGRGETVKAALRAHTRAALAGPADLSPGPCPPAP
jgi:AcrR family transcriptional regulator